MRQQINLVNPALLPPKPLLQLSSAIIILLALEALLAVVAALAYTPLISREQANKAEEGKLRQQEDHIKTRTYQLAQKKKSPLVEAELRQARDEQARLQTIAAWLDENTQADSGYSLYLQGLAQKNTDQLWLTQIQFEGKRISLEGMSTDAKSIPEFLAFLNGLKVFKGQQFTSFELDQPITPSSSASAVASSALTFRLYSKPEKRQ